MIQKKKKKKILKKTLKLKNKQTLIMPKYTQL